MPTLIIRWKAAIVAVVVVCCGVVGWAQVSTPCPVLGNSARVYGMEPRSGAPYSATVETTHEQKLVDGNAIHGSGLTHQARDTAGRTMSETSVGCALRSDGQLQPVVHVQVYDPTTRTTLVWSVSDDSPKVVHVIHQPSAAAPAVQTAQQQTSPPVRPKQRMEVRKENLGSKMIAGVIAEGSRTVRTIPAGREGNDLPIEIVDEVWMAKDLGLAVMSSEDDPRYGKSTSEVVELNQSEPDASLFAAPAGYKLEEHLVKTVSETSVQ
jgi:hypothetical protein